LKKVSYDRKNKQLTNFQDLHSFVIENYIKTIPEEKKPKDKDRQTILGWYSLIRKGEAGTRTIPILERLFKEFRITVKERRWEQMEIKTTLKIIEDNLQDKNQQGDIELFNFEYTDKEA